MNPSASAGSTAVRPNTGHEHQLHPLGEGSEPSAPAAAAAAAPADGESEDRGEVADEFGDCEGEVRQPRAAAVPKPPTKRELEEHLPLHIPYRTWCPVCVRAAATHDKHVPHADEERLDGVTTISMDYFFMDTKDEEAKNNPVIGMIDESTGESTPERQEQKGRANKTNYTGS